MIFIALGANLPSRFGQPLLTLRAALESVLQRGVKVESVSPYYRSAAWPDPNDPPFVNAVASLRTKLEPVALLGVLQDIERAFGRVRKAPNAPRTLDLDILDYGGRIEAGPPTLPHPRMAARAFVLVPLRDIAPLWLHPVSGQNIDELIAALPSETPMPERL